MTKSTKNVAFYGLNARKLKGAYMLLRQLKVRTIVTRIGIETAMALIWTIVKIIAKKSRPKQKK